MQGSYAVWKSTEKNWSFSSLEKFWSVSVETGKRKYVSRLKSFDIRFHKILFEIDIILLISC